MEMENSILYYPDPQSCIYPRDKIKYYEVPLNMPRVMMGGNI